MEQLFVPLDDTRNVLALLQRGYTFIEESSTDTDDASFIVVIPHINKPEDRQASLLSGLLKSRPEKLYSVERQYFDHHA